MVISMTNRLLALVIALVLSGGIAAHAAQAPQRPLAPIALPSASALPAALQTAASRITETATGAIDPSAAIRSAYQRNRVALAPSPAGLPTQRQRPSDVQSTDL